MPCKNTSSLPFTKDRGRNLQISRGDPAVQSGAVVRLQLAEGAVSSVRGGLPCGCRVPAAALVADSCIEIELAGGHRMRINGSYDPEVLARLIRGLSA